jgi:3-hydroxyacyl-[acyl-carrier-protein] dehydratase
MFPAGLPFCDLEIFMRFSLVDKITALEPGKSIAAVKNLSLAEEYLADHFPGFPVMPGVLMLESLVQAGAWLMRYTEDFRYSTVLLKQARAVKFNSFVSPGNTLVVNAAVQSWDEGQCVLKGTGTVNGESAVSARLTLEQFNLADRDAALTESDRMRIEKMRELFTQLWTPR